MNFMEMVAKITMNSEDFNKGVNDAQSSFNGLGSSIAGGAKKIGQVAVGAFTACATAIGGTTTALVANAKAVAQEMDAIDKNSQKLGISTTSYQEWDFVLEHCGSSVDSLKGAMKTMNKEFESSIDVINATHDAEAELERQLDSGEITFEEYNKQYDELYDNAYKDLGALGELGFSMSEIEQMAGDSDKAFAMIVEKLQQMPEGAERTALATDLLGKSAQELAPLLNMSADETSQLIEQVHELGGVMDEDAVKAGANFQDSLTNLKTAIGGMKNGIMTEFLPSMTTVMDGLTALFSGDEGGIAKITQGIEEFAQKVNEKLPQIIQTAGQILNALISALPQAFQAIASQLPSILEQAIPVLIDAVVGLADAVVDALPSIVDAIEKNLDKITSGLQKIVTSIGQIILKLTPKILPMLLRVGMQLVTELAKGFAENASEIIASIIQLVNIIIQELTNPDTLMTLIQASFTIVTAIAQGILENLPLLVDTLFTLLGNITEFLIEHADDVLNSALDLFQAIGEGALQAGAKILEKIGELLSKILGFEGLGKWFTDVYDKAKSIFENIGNAVFNAFNTIQNTLREFGEKIWNGIKEGIGDLFEKGKEMVMKIVDGIKSAWHYVTEALNPTTGTGMQDTVKKYKEMGEQNAQAYVDGQAEGFEVRSPSRKMKYIGEMVMAGFADGIEDESTDAFADIENTFSDMELPDLVIGAKRGEKGSSNAMTMRLDGLEQAINNLANRKEVIPIYVGGRQIDEVVVDSKNRVIKRSGGQVNA